MNIFFLLDWIGGPELVRAVFWVDLALLGSFLAFLGIRLVRHPDEPGARTITAFVLTALASHGWSFVTICADRFSLNGGYHDAAGTWTVYLTALCPGLITSIVTALIPSSRESRRATIFGPLFGILHTAVLFAFAPNAL